MREEKRFKWYSNLINMKSKYILFLTILFVSCASQKKMSDNNLKQNSEYKTLESFRGDTLNYVVSNFVEHKNQYIGKPASILFDKLQFEIKSFLGATDGTGAVYQISISYLNSNQFGFRLSERLKMVDIFITFENPIPWLTVLDLSPRGHLGEWSSKHREFFGKQIVKDIDYFAIPNDEKK
jgi:hypothetical protein